MCVVVVYPLAPAEIAEIFEIRVNFIDFGRFGLKIGEDWQKLLIFVLK